MGFKDKVRSYIKYNQENTFYSSRHDTFDWAKDPNERKGIYVNAITGEPVRISLANSLNAARYYGAAYKGSSLPKTDGKYFIDANGETKEGKHTPTSEIRFVPEFDMEDKGYGAYIKPLEAFAKTRKG